MSPTAPGVGRTSASTCAKTDSGTPRRVATRSRSESAKSSSPRIARAVTAATFARVPARSAMSSMTSCSISVESASMTSSPGPSRARIPAALWPLTRGGADIALMTRC